MPWHLLMLLQVSGHIIVVHCHRKRAGKRKAKQMVATLKWGQQKCLEACPGAAWYDVLADVFRSIRTLPIKATGVQPYLVNFEQYPEIPLTHALQW